MLKYIQFTYKQAVFWLGKITCQKQASLFIPLKIFLMLGKN